jgi:hypothetical protein
MLARTTIAIIVKGGSRISGQGEQGVSGLATASADSSKDKETIMTNAGVAAILSLVVPGVGQIYNGDFLRGAFWLVVTPGFWLGTGGLLGGACHLISAYTAYHRASAGGDDGLYCGYPRIGKTRGLSTNPSYRLR